MKRLLFVALLLAGAAHAQSSDQLIAEAKAKIALKMKDPESVRFAGLVVSPKGGMVCGWINAKNSYGGYVGYKPFYVMDRFAEVRDDEDTEFNNRSTFAMLWRGCGLVPDGEKFGDELVKLPELNIAKECAKDRKGTDRPDLYVNCEQNQADAKAWLQVHGTSHLIAYRCAQDVRRYDSYSMGRSCVESRETHALIDRGPPADLPAADGSSQTAATRFKCLDAEGKSYTTTTATKGCTVE